MEKSKLEKMRDRLESIRLALKQGLHQTDELEATIIETLRAAEEKGTDGTTQVLAATPAAPGYKDRPL